MSKSLDSFLDAGPEPVTELSAGQFLKRDRVVWQIVNSDMDEVVLVKLGGDGHRWSNPAAVTCPSHIASAEMRMIIRAGYSTGWSLLTTREAAEWLMEQCDKKGE